MLAILIDSLSDSIKISNKTFPLWPFEDKRKSVHLASLLIVLTQLMVSHYNREPSWNHFFRYLLSLLSWHKRLFFLEKTIEERGILRKTNDCKKYSFRTKCFYFVYGSCASRQSRFTKKSNWGVDRLPPVEMKKAAIKYVLRSWCQSIRLGARRHRDETWEDADGSTWRSRQRRWWWCILFEGRIATIVLDFYSLKDEMSSDIAKKMN